MIDWIVISAISALVAYGVVAEIRGRVPDRPASPITNLVHSLGPDDRVPAEWLAPRVAAYLAEMHDRMRMRP